MEYIGRRFIEFGYFLEDTKREKRKTNLDIFQKDTIWRHIIRQSKLLLMSHGFFPRFRFIEGNQIVFQKYWAQTRIET